MVRPALVLALLAAHAGAASLPSRMGMYQQSGGSLAMLDSKVAIVVHGPIVEATIAQTFRNDSDRVVEATYIFPLPPDAAVSAMAIDYGNRKVHASIVKREDAQHRYEDAVAAGLGAGLLDQERPDVFTQTVSAIPAHGTVVVTLRYDAIARYASGTWQLALPMVVAPRYVPGTASGRSTSGTGRAPDTDRAPDASRVTPNGSPAAGGKTDVTIDLGDAADVTSPTHELQKRGAVYALVDEHSDHDAIVRWRAKVPAAGWVEQDDDGGYAAMIVEAPAGPAHHKNSLRTAIVVDRAATTRGDTDSVAHPFVRALLGAFDGKDVVSVTGSIQTDWRAPEDVLHATELAWRGQPGAFDLTKVLLATHGSQVVLVTDGLVADDRAAIAAARKVGGPIHVVGVGPSPNRSLLQQIAAVTGGTVRFAVVGDDVSVLARDVVADVAAPPAALAVTWGTLAARDVVPAVMPQLGSGQSALVVARVAGAHAANARARGDVFAFGSIATPRPPEGATTLKGPIARRWARAKLDDLVAANDRNAIATHALRYGLVSPMTSMIAIGDEVIVEGGVKHTVQVPVSVPAGMQWQAVQRELTVDTTTTGEIEGRRAEKHGAKGGEATASKATKKAKDSDAESDKKPAKKKWRPVAREDGDDAAKSEEDESSRQEPRPATTPTQAPAPDVATASAPGAYNDEVMLVTGLQERGVLGRNRLLRLSLALGASVEKGNADALVATRLSLDFGGLTRLGFEGSIWFVGGLDVQGTLLATISRIGIGRWIELQGGVGLHLGDGLGPAGALELRVRTPARHISPYLRYDGALLYQAGTRDGQNAGTIGVEASF
jgi:Ca-activated chloride channel family protein